MEHAFRKLYKTNIDLIVLPLKTTLIIHKPECHYISTTYILISCDCDIYTECLPISIRWWLTNEISHRVCASALLDSANDEIPLQMRIASIGNGEGKHVGWRSIAANANSYKCFTLQTNFVSMNVRYSLPSPAFCWSPNQQPYRSLSSPRLYENATPLSICIII